MTLGDWALVFVGTGAAVFVVAWSKYLEASRITGGHQQPTRTKSEARVIETFERILGYELPTAHPEWLVRHGKRLELDGYNEKEKLAVEFSGPLHTRFIKTESYPAYYERLCKDVLKKIMCKRRGVDLIVIDMFHLCDNLEGYIRSRLSDIGRVERPYDYIPEIHIEPYRSPALENIGGLVELDTLLGILDGLNTGNLDALADIKLP